MICLGTKTMVWSSVGKSKDHGRFRRIIHVIIYIMQGDLTMKSPRDGIRNRISQPLGPESMRDGANGDAMAFEPAIEEATVAIAEPTFYDRKCLPKFWKSSVTAWKLRRN